VFIDGQLKVLRVFFQPLQEGQPHLRSWKKVHYGG